MEKVYTIYLIIKYYMMEIGKMIINMDKEHSIIQMEIYIQENLKKIIKMVMDIINLIMVKFILVFLLKIILMVMVILLIQMGIDIQEILKMEKEMGLEHFFIKMEKNILDYGKIILKMEKVNIII